MDELSGFIIGAAHEAKIFKNCLNRIEDNLCKCACTPSEVGEEFVSSEEEGRMELSYASAPGVSMLLLLWKIQFLFLFQLQLCAALALPLLFLPWKRLQKKLLSSVMTWMVC